jgi:hypothetical protein
MVILLGILSSAVVASAAGPTASDSMPGRADGRPVARPVAMADTSGVARAASAGDTTRPRRRSVEVSEWYNRRLTIHRIASYTMLPLFATEYVLGDRMLDQREDAFHGRGSGVSDNTLRAHQIVAGGVAALFGINTITGVWNLYDSRHQEAGRTRRTVHALLMLASDAGFTATGLIAEDAANGGLDAARRHRNVAVASMVPATIGATMMWVERLRGR